MKPNELNVNDACKAMMAEKFEIAGRRYRIEFQDGPILEEGLSHACYIYHDRELILIDRHLTSTARHVILVLCINRIWHDLTGRAATIQFPDPAPAKWSKRAKPRPVADPAQIGPVAEQLGAAEREQLAAPFDAAMLRIFPNGFGKGAA